MSNSASAKSSGIGFLGLLTLLFITLKLLGVTAVASWSWWWVLSPLWIPIGLGLGILAIIGILLWAVSRS